MKPIMQRIPGILISLVICVFLSGCCGLCKKCVEGAECTTTPSNAATGIESTAGRPAPPADTDEPGTPDTALPEGSRVSYPLFEGDYFSVTLPDDPGWVDVMHEGSVALRVCPEGAPLVHDVVNRMEQMAKAFFEYLPGYVHSGFKEHAEELSEIGRAIGELSVSTNSAIRRTCATETVENIIRHMGFSDTKGNNTINGEFFDVTPYEMYSGGGDIRKVATINCQTRPPADPNDSNHFCNMSQGEQDLLIKRATGMDADDYLDRELVRYFYYQRPQYQKWPTDTESSEKLCRPEDQCPDVFIEHVIITATTRPNGTVISVKGRVFPSYKITNERKLESAEAIEIAYRQLLKIPGISEYAHPPPSKQKLPLVLLPYEHTTRFDLSRLSSFSWPGYKTPQLRYAYRTTLWGEYIDEDGERIVEAASWRAWIDAETGDILQLIPQFAFSKGIEAKGKGWRPTQPSYPVIPNYSETDTSPGSEQDNCSNKDSGDCPTEMTFYVDDFQVGSKCECPGDFTSNQRYCLKLAGVFDQVDYMDRRSLDNSGDQVLKHFCSKNTEFAEGLSCKIPWDCLCGNVDYDTAVRYLLMNAYAHVYTYKQKLDWIFCHSKDEQPQTIHPICINGEFQTAKNKGSDSLVPLRIRLGDDSQGVFEAETNKPHLTFGELDKIFTMGECTSENRPDLSNRPGAQDATLMTHEFAHVIMGGLLASRPTDWCEPEEQEELDCPVPLSSDIVHDMADGFSAVSNRTDWFGLWRGNASPDTHSDAGGQIRKFDHTEDKFPHYRLKYRVDVEEKDQSSVEGQTYVKKGYADGQIAAAALWEVTEYMYSALDEAGVAAFEATLFNVLSNHFIPNSCRAFVQGQGALRQCDYPDDCDLDVYRYLHFLLESLIDNDKTNEVTVNSNKIAAGFAKAEIFLVPPRCIGASTTADPPPAVETYCPTIPNNPTNPITLYGGDAVINITDDWLDHDSNEGSPDLPKFEVWTGPKFQFDGVEAHLSELSLCNESYNITIANNADFDSADAGNFSHETGWLKTGGTCEAHWSWDPNDAENDSWNDFWEEITRKSQNEGGSEVYYRVWTRNSDETDALMSSSEYPGIPRPQSVQWSDTDQRVGPPMAVLNATGEKEL